MNTFLLLMSLCLISPDEPQAGFQTGALQPQSMGTLAFGPQAVLFIGDAMAGKIYAVDLADRDPLPEQKQPLRVFDIERKIAALLGADAAEILIHDMAVNPLSKNIYLTVSRGREKWDNEWKLPNDVDHASILIRLTPPGQLAVVDLSAVSHASVSLPSPVDTDKMQEWKGTSLRVDAITDLVYHDGKLLVAGLSNEEFASTLRVVPFPFDGSVKATTLEIYHGAHGKFETHAPIRTLVPYTRNGEAHILAAYLCTPLVTFPLSAIEAGGHVKGKTLAELGFGNYPLDMIRITSKNGQRILLSNSTREFMVFDVAKLSAFDQPITSKTQSVREGVEVTTYGLPGLQQMDDFDETSFVVLKRMAYGQLDLRQVGKANF